MAHEHMAVGELSRQQKLFLGEVAGPDRICSKCNSLAPTYFAPDKVTMDQKDTTIVHLYGPHKNGDNHGCTQATELVPRLNKKEATRLKAIHIPTVLRVDRDKGRGYTRFTTF